MPQIDLVTGFLGAGKTTFIKKYAKFLTSQGLTVGILENDYGAINIDMVFLEELMGNNCDVEMIVGGDGILSHHRRFYTKLISMSMTGFDRVIVEPSGIYDTDEFFDVLAEEPLCDWYSPGSIISIIDADLEDELSEETEYLLCSQTDTAGKILLSRWKDDDPERTAQKKQEVADRLNRVMERFHSDRRFSPDDIVAMDWDAMAPEDIASIAMSGMVPASHMKLPVDQKSGYGTLFYYGIAMPEEELRSRIRQTFDDPACGKVMRIKGFVRTGEGTRMQVNATQAGAEIEPTVFAQEALIITGEGLDRSRIDAIWADSAEIITPGDSVM